MKPSVAVRLLIAVLGCGALLGACQAPQAPFGGVVAAASPEATAAGVEILEAGGNAVDAAVAVSFALAVTEPAMSGLGGQSQMLVHAPGQAPVVLNGTSFSPRGTDPAATRDDLTGRRATTVPATVRTLHYAWQHFGSGHVDWPALLAPAIRFAEDGFVMGPFRHRVFARHADDLRADSAARALFLDEQGAVPEAGSLFKQPVLARTLRRLATHGADDFYHGQTAREITRDMARNGGWITLEDLANVPDPVEVPPLHGTFRGWDLYTMPPPGGGWVVLQILNLLEASAPADLAPGAEARPACLADALQIAHRNRRRHPVEDFDEYDEAVAQRTSKETARALLAAEATPSTGETTHFSVADADGMVVAVTASINAYFGARTASPTLGFLYNSYMHEYERGQPGHPFALRPQARPYSSMSPTVLARDGVPVLALGSPGSARIISAVAQVVQLWVDAGLGVEEAVAFRRVHVVPERRLFLEDEALRSRLHGAMAARGYTLEEPRTDLARDGFNPYFGGVHAVAHEQGRWRGAADPRRDGTVGYARPPAEASPDR